MLHLQRVSVSVAFKHEEHALRLSGPFSGRVAAAARLHFHDVLREVSANPESGRASTQARVPSQNGSRLVTMSLITPFGITA